MPKNQKFREFIWRITKASKLKVGAFQEAFRAEVAQQVEAVQKYFNVMDDIWNSWKKINRVDFISQFVEQLGPTLFLTWLSDVYPFDYDRLQAECPTSPTTEEAIIELFYEYDEVEIKIIEDVLTSQWIKESTDHIAQLLLIEAIKSISGIFSGIIQHPFKIFTSNVELIPEPNLLLIHCTFAGRVEK